MLSVDLIFKIAAIGIITAVLNQVLSRAGKEEMATMTSLAGLVIVLAIILDLIANLFDTIKSLFNLY